MWADHSSLLCGKRGRFSYLNATRVEMNMETKEFPCVGGLTPCSTNTDLGGSTFCAASPEFCPVMDIEILASESTSSKIRDNDYTKRLSLSSTYGKNMYLAFSKTTNAKSNSPLQQLKFELGQPCAFEDQKNLFWVGAPEPTYYELEKITTMDACMRYYKKSEDETTGLGVDARYNRLAELSVRPNEFEI